MCGKNSALPVKVNQVAGSPPRVREKHTESLQQALPARITPACAGKTSLPIIRYNIAWDHPRVCGKNLSIRDLLGLISGSPPRVREKHIQRNQVP